MDALFARAARLVKVDYAAPAVGHREDDGRRRSSPGSSTGSPVRWTASSDASAASSASTRAPIATGGLADLVAPHSETIERDRPVPHARGAAARLGAERVIPDPPAIGLFVVAALALLLVPGPGRALRRRALDPPGSPCRARRRCSASTSGRSSTSRRRRSGSPRSSLSSAVAFTAVKIAGAVYLIGLGLWTLFSRRAEPTSRSAASGTCAARSRRASSSTSSIRRRRSSSSRSSRSSSTRTRRTPRCRSRFSACSSRCSASSPTRSGRSRPARPAGCCAARAASCATQRYVSGHGLRRARRRDRVRRRSAED